MLKETIYSPQSIPNGIIPFFRAIFRDFRLGHNLGRQLFIRDRKAQYRESFLGIFWAFAPAFVTALLWIFLNGARVIKVDITGMSFPLYTITGTLFWQIIYQSITLTMGCVNQGKSLLTKLNFPRESLLIHAFYNILFNITVLFIVTCVIALFLGWRPGWSFLFFPLVMIDLVIIGFSIGLFFLSIFSLIADFSRLVPIAMQLLMYVSAVIFPMPKTAGFARTVFNINPFTHVIIFARDIFVGLPVENVAGFTTVSIVSVFLLALGLLTYRITMPIIIERMGS
jgi:lipopolysaccharide transport system permease protein